MRIDNLDDSPTARQSQTVRKHGTKSPVGRTSVSEGALEIRSNEGLLVEGSQKVSGWLIVTGTLKVVGTFLLEGVTTITGALASSGTALFTGLFTTQGTTRFEGDTTQQGPFHVVGPTDVTGNLTVNAPGKIVISGGTSPATLQNGALSFGTGAKLEADGAGARLISGTGPRAYVFPTAVALQYDPTHYVMVTSTQTTVKGPLVVDSLSTLGSKLFSMPHPTIPNTLIQHGSTESPVSGIEYWGEGEFDEHGSAVIRLPSYFEALAKPGNRSVFVAARGSYADWSDIDGGCFSVSGAPAGRFSWLVKGERFGGDFEVEPAQPAAADRAS